MKYLSIQTFQCGISVSGLATFTGGAEINILSLNGATTSSEASLFLGAHSSLEGGQLVLQKGTGQTYAAHLDNYSDQFRVLFGTNTGSAGVAMSINLATRQLTLPTYTSTSSFPGTVAGYLAFDSVGNIITTSLALSGYVPTSRTLTINGTSYDLSADRTWTINTVDYTSRLQHQVKAGVAINKGQAVYVTSADGTNMIVGLASNASEATSSKTMGLLDATVTTNGFANVVTEGLLAGLDTSTAGAEGDPVWLGTGGNLIYGLANKPYAPAHLVFIGIVTRKNANNGEIFVKVQNGFELKEIHDVDLITNAPTAGQLLRYNSDGLWKNWSPNYLTAEADTLATVTGRDATTNTSITVGPDLIVQADGSVNYTASRLWLNSHNNYRGAGVHMSGVGSTWFAGTPYTDFDGGYVIARTGTSNDVSSAQYSNALLTVKSNGNVGIGTTNPTYKLDVNGSIRTSGVGGLNIDASANFGDNSGANFDILNLGSTRALRILATSNNGWGNILLNVYGGNVGIGTTSPSYKLQVNADGAGLYVLGANTAPYTQTIASFVYGGNSNSINIENQAGKASIQARAGGSTMDLLLNPVSGNVGIGTGSPIRKLHVNGDVQVDTNLAVSSGIYNTNYYAGSATATYFKNSVGTDTLTILQSGNVGIGTTNPSHNLHIYGAGDRLIKIENTGTYLMYVGLLSNEGYIGSTNATALGFYTNNVNRIYINTSGNIGIGTTSPNFKFQVNHGTGAEYVASFRNTNDNLQLKIGTTTGNLLNIQGATISTNAVYNIALQAEGGNVGIGTTLPSQILHVAGNIRVTGAFYDSNNQAGTAGQILKSTGTGTDWVSLSEITGVDGTGTANYLAKWSDADTITNSLIYDNGTSVTINATSGGIYLNSNIGFGGPVNINDQFKFYYGQLQGNGNAYFTTYLNVGTSSNLGATLNVRGAGATSATKSLYIPNSDDSRTLSYTDDGKLTLSNGTYTTKWYVGSGYSPTLEFSAQGNITWGNGAIFRFYSTGDTTDYRLENGTFHTNHSQARFYAGGSGYLGFETIGSTTAYDAIGAVFTDNNTVSLRFFYKNTGSDIEGMRLTSSGNFLVGTTTDSGYKLDVNGTARIKGNVDITTSGGTNVLLAYSSYVQAWQSFYVSQGGGAHNFAVSNASSGGNAYFNNVNVGIGTTNPLGKLHIADDGPNALRIGDTQVSTIGETNDGGYPGMKIVPYNSNIHIGISSTNDNKINLWYAGNNYTYWQQTSTYSVISNYSTNALVFQVNGGNVGIGTTDPQYKLDVAQVIRSKYGSNEGGIYLGGTPAGVAYVAGAVRATPSPSYSYTGKLSFYTTTWGVGTDYGITEQMYIDVTGSDTKAATLVMLPWGGNVGIGTTAPAQQLHVTQNIALGLTGGSIGDTNNILFPTVNGTHTYAPNGIFYTKKGSWGGQIDIRTSYDWGYATDNAKISLNGAEGNGIVFYTGASALGSTERVRITSDGNVGIGTTSPTAKLHVAGNIVLGSTANGYQEAGSKYIGLSYPSLGTDGYVGFQFESVNAPAPYNGNYSQNIKFYTHHYAASTGGTPRMTIQYDGNVGIGTSTPSQKFVVSNGSSEVFKVYGGGEVVAGTNYIYAAYSGGTSFYAQGPASFRNGIHNDTNTYLKIDGGTSGFTYFSGNVGIGTTSPGKTLDITGEIRTSGRATFNEYVNTGFIYGNTDLVLAYSGGTSGITIKAITGNVGIGTINPPYKLTVAGDTYVTNANLHLNTGYGIVDAANISYKIGFASLGNFAFENVNVGIGTTSPATKLDVSGVITATGGNSTNWNTAYGWGNHSSAGYVPQTRTLTINGTSYDLSANRSWTIATTTPGGSDTQFQYNSSGSLAGASALTYNSANNRIGVNQASPGYDFDVNGQVRVQDKLRVGTVNSGNGVVHMSSSATINPNTTTIVWAQNVSVGMCAFIEYYILNNNSLTDQRAGTIMVTWNQSGTPTIAHTETTTPDIGSTTAVNFTSTLVGSDARINAVNSSANPYTIVMSYKYF